MSNIHALSENGIVGGWIEKKLRSAYKRSILTTFTRRVTEKG